MRSLVVVCISSLSHAGFLEHLVDLVRRQRVPERHTLLDAGLIGRGARGARLVCPRPLAHPRAFAQGLLFRRDRFEVLRPGLWPAAHQPGDELAIARKGRDPVAPPSPAAAFQQSPSCQK
jgi:hypothetical protein